jgi:hypothetical protein
MKTYNKSILHIGMAKIKPQVPQNKRNKQQFTGPTISYPSIPIG